MPPFGAEATEMKAAAALPVALNSAARLVVPDRGGPMPMRTVEFGVRHAAGDAALVVVTTPSERAACIAFAFRGGTRKSEF